MYPSGNLWAFKLSKVHMQWSSSIWCLPHYIKIIALFLLTVISWKSGAVLWLLLKWNVWYKEGSQSVFVNGIELGCTCFLVLKGEPTVILEVSNVSNGPFFNISFSPLIHSVFLDWCTEHIRYNSNKVKKIYSTSGDCCTYLVSRDNCSLRLWLYLLFRGENTLCFLDGERGSKLFKLVNINIWWI